jgi:aconitate decarboxylase
VNRPQPKSGLDGKFSVQYTTLAALLDGEVTVDTFTNERLFATDVAALLPKVHFVADDSIPLDKAKLHIIVTIWLRDGREVSKKIDNQVTGWLGSKDNPPTREQRLKKFFSCTKRLLSERDAARMLELVERLETLSDVAEIMDIARCDGRQA